MEKPWVHQYRGTAPSPPQPSYPQVGVELVQDQAHGAGQVADVGRLLVQGVLEHLKVLHPLDGKAVVNDVGLQVKVKVGFCQFQQMYQTNRGI